jgi:hypothetical protein
MCRVVLRRHSHAYGAGSLRRLGEITGVRKYNDYTECQKQRNEPSTISVLMRIHLLLN